MSFGRRIFGGTVVITLSSVVARLLAFFTIPILTRVLGPEPYGQAAILGTITAIATTLALFGIDQGYARFGLQGRKSEQVGIERFVWRWSLISALAVGCAAAVTWIGVSGRESSSPVSNAVFIIVTTVSAVVLILATTRVRLAGRYGRIGLATVAGALVGSLVSVSVAIWIRTDVWALLVGGLAAAWTVTAILGLPSPQDLVKPSGLGHAQRRELLALGASSMVSAPVYWLMTSTDRWFISAHDGVSAVGLYSVAAQMGTLGLMLNSALTLTWFPEISRAYENGGPDSLKVIAQNGNRILVGLLIVWAAISTAGGDVLRMMTSAEFHSAAPLVPWFAAGAMFYGMCTLFVTNLFLAKKMRYVAVSWIGGGVVTLASYAALVPVLGSGGAAIGQVCGFALIATLTWASGHRVLPIPFPLARIGGAASVALLAIIFLSPPWSATPALSLMLKAPIGAILAIVLVWVAEPGALGRILATTVSLIGSAAKNRR